MESVDILKMAVRGEDGQHQFRTDVTNVDALAADMVAFSNSEGGKILIGVNVDGTLSLLSQEDTRRLNQLVSNAASQSVRPPINPRTETVSVLGRLVLVVHVAEGMRKPYIDNEGTIWIKSSSDKRKVTSAEEIQMMCRASGVLHGDELPAHGLTIADLDTEYFKVFFERNFGKSVEKQDIPLALLLRNMNLMKGDVLNTGGALLFALSPNVTLPHFLVKAVAYPGCAIDAESCTDSRDILGKLADIFFKSMGFVLGNLGSEKATSGSSRPGDRKVPQVVFEELIANALLHRDYFVSAPIRISIFRDCVDIVSPGHLPHNLTVENIQRGNAYIRNPILASFATKLLPYRGLENGIVRALKAYPHIEFKDGREGNEFKATIRLPPVDNL